MEFTIRVANSKDIVDLLELEKEAHSEISWWKKQTKKEFLHSMSISKYNVMVAIHNEKIIGYIQAELNIRGYGRFKSLFLENIYVLKKYRRKGVAKLLVQMFTVYWCKKRKYVELVTTKKNRKIFEHLGFEWTMVYMKIGPNQKKVK